MSQRPDELQPGAAPGILAALIFYGGMLGVAWLLGVVWLDLNLLVWPEKLQGTTALHAALGAGVGLATVVASRLVERYTDWGRRLGEGFAGMLGAMTPGQIQVLALTSGVAEEIFFRGFLQQAFSTAGWAGPYGEWVGLGLASVIFGLIHIGPERETFRPWTYMALGLGVVFGLMYLYTGSVLAPVIAHITVNYFNLGHISRQALAEGEASSPEDER
ncbi:CPBP family intramembrane metalloprotease [Lujinxingia vulgaris]|uniref:CPBP family intramembrane metalloprotease n=1 Tax=Lujinxingia vulgaris TaxID=2600176 RepID=A0A5C6XB54_9DELT|nr:CPBP family intramembrane glutamic endopeptidase [Lujinxingia vulgaris]TXD36435.1 CPBP family intramembrane metalloprotease [Lujinxingia vulgaris]